MNGRITMYFLYGEKEIDYLKKKDKKLAFVIDYIGHINRTVDTDLFSAVLHHIIAQQISTKAQQTIWQRINNAYQEINPEIIYHSDTDKLQSFGITSRKAEYIKDCSKKIVCGEFDLTSIEKLSDKEAIEAMISLKGVGVWTAEMILLFCLQRPNILSYGDLALLRGMRMVYHHRKIDETLFEKYRKRLSPYCSVASLYFWAVAGGAVEGMKDYAPKNKK